MELPPFGDPIARERRKGMYKTAPYDPRFPNTNQTKRCWLNYVDYWKCAKLKGEDNPVCGDFLYAYKQKCPQVWTEKWDGQRAEGRHPVREINDVEPKF